MFEAPVFTDGGRRLLNRAIAGETLTFSCIKMGKGSIASPAEIASMTDLVDPVTVLDVYKVRADGETATVTASFSNQALGSGFLFKELGLFAKDPDGGADILYCYQNAYDTAEYISASANEIIEKQISILSIVGSAEHVSAVVDGSTVYVTWKELEEYMDSHPRIFVQKEEPDVVNCLWIKPLSSDPSPEEETGLLQLSDDLSASKYYVEIDNTLNAIENAVETDSELADGNYKIEIL